MTERRKIRLHAYMSSKGGVGKSTLSVATAWLAAAAPGREAVLLDLDLWGSSLGDGLPLCAPVVAEDEHSVLRFSEPPTGRFMSRDDTLRARHRRRFTAVSDGSLPPFLPYINDALFVKAEGDALTVAMDHFLWRFDGPLGELPLWVMPSSPLSDDLSRVAAWMVEVRSLEIWAARVWWIVLTLIRQRPGLTDIVCDLPPGMVGLTLPFFLMIAAQAAGRPQPDGFPAPDPTWDIEVQSALVTTPDLNALAVTAEAFLAHKGESPGLVLIVNRAQGGRGEVQAGLYAHFAPFFGMDPYRLDRQCLVVDERRDFRRFEGVVRGLQALDEATLANLQKALRGREVES